MISARFPRCPLISAGLQRYIIDLLWISLSHPWEALSFIDFSRISIIVRCFPLDFIDFVLISAGSHLFFVVFRRIPLIACWFLQDLIDFCRNCLSSAGFHWFIEYLIDFFRTSLISAGVHWVFFDVLRISLILHWFLEFHIFLISAGFHWVFLDALRISLIFHWFLEFHIFFISAGLRTCEGKLWLWLEIRCINARVIYRLGPHISSVALSLYTQL